jgi:hypothetical protein
MRRLRAAKGVLDPSDPLIIRIPRFQRGLVWEDEKKRQLIDSLIRKFPVGALLVSEVMQEKTADGRPVPVYQLIDGLQRTQAIAEHLEEPLARVPRDVIPTALLAQLQQVLIDLGLGTVATDDLAGSVESWFQKVRVLDQGSGFNPLELITHVTNELAIAGVGLSEAQALNPVAANILDAARDATDIGGSEIPVLVYAGDQNELPEVFARLNRQGTTLSKYQIFAAAWVSDTTVATNPEVRKAIDKKYADLKDEGFEVEEDPNVDPTSVSLFEYLYGLSRHLKDRYPLLLRGDANDASDAFSLVTLVRGQRLDRMDQLPTFVADRDKAGRLDPSRMEKALDASIEFVREVLAPFLGLQLTAGGRQAHGELQIVSIIAAVATHRYASDSDWREVSKPSWRKLEKRFKAGIPQHYLLDLIRQTWRGPLYSLAYDRVWDSGGGGRVMSDFYLNAPSKATWDAALTVWFDEQLAQKKTSRPNVSSLEKTFLRFAYGPIVTVAAANASRFDVEHLFPVGRLVELAKRDASGGWPVGSLANLALLDDATNRRKRDETIHEYFSGARAPKPAERAVIETYLLCDEADVDIPKVAGVDTLSQKDYVAFLQARWPRLVDALYAALGI